MNWKMTSDLFDLIHEGVMKILCASYQEQMMNKILTKS